MHPTPHKWQWTHVSPKQLAELQEDVANSHLSQFKKFSIRERLVSAGEAENRDAQIAKVSSVIELLEAAKHYVDNSPEVSREQTTHRITQKIFEIFVGGDNNESASGIMPNFEKTLRDGGNRSAPNGKPIKDWIAEIDYDCYVFVGQATSHERPVANALVWLGVYQLLEEKRITLKLDRLIEIFANVKTELEKTKNNNKKPSKPTEWSDSAKLSFAETTVNNTIEIIKRKYRALAEEKDKKIVRHYRDWYDRGLRNLFPSSKYEEQLREQLRNKLQMYVGLWEGPSTSTLAKGND